MKQKPIKHHIDGLIALRLFGVFAVCVLAVLLTGADAYRRLTQRDRAAYDRRTCVQYVATRVRQADALDRVAVEDFNGISCLTLQDGDGYVTRVYCYDGYLMELYCGVDVELEPGDGEQIIPAGGLDLSLEDGLLTVAATDAQGTQSTLLLSLRSGEGAGP